jgi:hypothetical protein
MVSNTDRAQLAALRVADVAGEGLVGAAVIAAKAALVAYGVPDVLVAGVLARVEADLRQAIRGATAPTVTAPGVDSDLPEV